MTNPLKRVATINIVNPGYSNSKSWMFLVPVEMTSETWRAIIDREIRNLTAAQDFNPEEYVTVESLVGIVVEKLAKHYPLTTYFHVDYPAEIIRDDRGMGRVLERPLLGKIEEHNDLIDRRDAADNLKIYRKPRGGK